MRAGAIVGNLGLPHDVEISAFALSGRNIAPLFVSPTTFLEVKADRTIAINGVVVTRVCVVEP